MRIKRMMNIVTRTTCLLLVMLFSSSLSANANTQSIEILHWWTAPGEERSLKLLENTLDKEGISWTDSSIMGEGGSGATRVLQMRALAGNPPDVAQIKGPDIGEWYRLGMLKPLDELSDTQKWSEKFAPIVLSTITFNHHYIAAPFNIHRVNWLWLNKKIFDKLKLSAPKTWDEFFIVADKIKAAGYIALAHGDTDWQDALLFESLAISMLGANKYKQAFVDNDPVVLESDEMIAVFKRFKRFANYIPKNGKKEWYEATKMLIDNKAAMQMMGDWAKGMLTEKGAVAGKDYICAEVPETKGVFSYNIDSFVFFNQGKALKESIHAQDKLVNVILSPEFQRDFSLVKGSIPARLDVDMSQFDSCSQYAAQLLKNSELVPSFTQNLATTSYIQKIMSKIISQFFSDPNASAEATVKRLSLAIRAVK